MATDSITNHQDLMAFSNWFSTRNSELEKSVFIEKNFSLEMRGRIVTFLNEIRAEFCSSAIDQIPLRNELRQYFRSWKLWLMHKHKYVYYDDLYRQQTQTKNESITSEIPKFLRASIPNKVRTTHNHSNKQNFAKKQPAGGDTKQLEEIFKISNTKFETVIADIDLSNLLSTISKDADNLGHLCMWADFHLRTSKMSEAFKILHAVCAKIQNQPSNNSNTIQYLHSWAFHLKGNAYFHTGDSLAAIERYRDSIELKKTIAVPLIHTIQSQTRLALAYAHVDSKNAFSLLSGLEALLNHSKTKDNLVEDSARHYHNSHSDITHAIGQRHFLSRHTEHARNAWKASYDSALKAESKVRQLTAQISLGSINESQANERIEALITETQKDAVLLDYSRRLHRDIGQIILLRNENFGSFLDHQLCRVSVA